MALTTLFRKASLAPLPLLALLFLATVNLSAQTVVTTNAGDESNGSLGWAVTTLNNAGAGAISIGSTIGPITLTQPPPIVTQSVTFQGGNAAVIDQNGAQAKFLFQQGFTLDPYFYFTINVNGGLSSGLDAALTASSWNLLVGSYFFIQGGNGTASSTAGGAFVTLGTASTALNSAFTMYGGTGANGTGLGGGNGGAAAVSAASLSLSGTNWFLTGGWGGADSYQVGNAGSATLSVGSLNMDSGSTLTDLGGAVNTSNGALGNGGNAVLTANSISLTGNYTELDVWGGSGGSPQAAHGSGPVNAGDGGSVSVWASSVTVDSQAILSVTGGAGGTGFPTSSGRGGIGGGATVLIGNLNLANGGSMGVTAGDGGQGANGWFGGAAFVNVGSLNQDTGSRLSIVSGAGGGSLSGGALNFTMTSQTLALGATFIAQGGAGGSGASAGGNGGVVQVGGQALTLASGSLWEVLGGEGGTGTSTNGTGSSVFVSLHDLEGSGTVSIGGPGQGTLQLTGGNFAGVIAGTESLNITGFGVVTLTGANTYSGGTTLSTGILFVNSDSNLGVGNLTLDDGTLETGNFNTSKAISLTSNNGTLVVTPADLASFNGIISGPGGLQLAGGGNFILNAVNTYTGATDIADGNLCLLTGAKIAGPVTVESPSALVGNGVILGTVTNNGVVEGGTTNSPGTLTVASYTQTSNGILQTNLLPTQASLLNVNGGATLSGSVTADSLVPLNGVRYQYTLLTAGSLNGTFTTTDFNALSGLTSSLSYGTNDVVLTLVRPGVDFTPLAVGTNQIVLANVFNSVVTTGNASNDFFNKLNELYALPSGQGEVLGQLTGDLYTALPGIILDNAQFEDNLLFDRLEEGGVNGMGSAQAGLVRNILAADVSGPAGQAAGLANPGVGGLWIENTDSAGSVNSDGNVEGFNKSNYGFLAGYDTELSKGFTGGIMGGWVHTDVTGTYTGVQAGVNSTQFGVYGSKRFGAVELGLVAGYGLDQMTANRTVSIGSDVNQLAGNAAGSQVQAALQGSYNLGLPGFTVKPLAGIGYAHLSQNAFTETGSDSLALAVPAQSTDSLRPYLGLDSSKFFTLDQDLGILPHLNLSVSQELMDSATSYQTSLSGAPDNPFTVTGITPSATTLGLEAGMKLLFGKQLNLFADYQGHFSGTENLNTFSGGLDISF